MPPRIKIFLWRACLGYLPVLVVLCNRDMHLDPSCPLCHQAPETIPHALLHCSNASSHLLECNVSINPGARDSLANVILSYCPSMNLDQLGSFATALWVTWSQRNTQVWTGHNLPPSFVAWQGTGVRKGLE